MPCHTSAYPSLCLCLRLCLSLSLFSRCVDRGRQEGNQNKSGSLQLRKGKPHIPPPTSMDPPRGVGGLYYIHPRSFRSRVSPRARARAGERAGERGSQERPRPHSTPFEEEKKAERSGEWKWVKRILCS